MGTSSVWGEGSPGPPLGFSSLTPTLGHPGALTQGRPSCLFFKAQGSPCLPQCLEVTSARRTLYVCR